jgi:hypothetical protein
MVTLEVVYIRTILRDFGVQQNQPTLVYEDNLTCIVVSINPVFRKLSRHIDIRHHYIRELCLGNLVKTSVFTYQPYGHRLPH